MIPELMIFGIQIILGISIIAFISEYIDASLGMGYGTSLTPLLLIMGYSPLDIVPAVLLSEIITGILAGILHHKVGNVNFRNPIEQKVTLVLVLCSVFGTLAAVMIAINLPTLFLKTYIGILVLVMGVIILATRKKIRRFSWRKIVGIGVLAAFNKGMSGGGYGPVITGGQMLSGMDGRKAIGITSLAEGLTCVVGVLLYLFASRDVNWTLLAPSLILGAVLSVPLSAHTVKKIPETSFRTLVGLMTIILGLYTLANTYLL